jgi:hypothetical protein
MRDGLKIFDADAHVVYPKDMWSTRYLEKRYADRIERPETPGFDIYNPSKVDGRWTRHPVIRYGQLQKNIDRDLP